MKKVTVVFGTRPEAIKMAPVIKALRDIEGIETQVVVTGQHRHILDQVLDFFRISPEIDLDLMQPGQGLDALFAAIITTIGNVLEQKRPDLVLVHGDTITTLATALACFHAKVPLGHVEAGLRTGNMLAPWPEEGYRKLIAPLTCFNFAPTTRARQNLLAEGIDRSTIHITGNTVVDAMLWATERLESDATTRVASEKRLPPLRNDQRIILATVHRRESFGAAFERICKALKTLALRENVQIIYPVHPNPQVREPALRHLSSTSNIHLTEPLEYPDFILLMQRSHFVLTDSGGIQEEAPALGKPVLVLREETERLEAIQAGTARLVGTDVDDIVQGASQLLDDNAEYQSMSKAQNPFGDGHAAERIARIIASN